MMIRSSRLAFLLSLPLMSLAVSCSKKDDAEENAKTTTVPGEKALTEVSSVGELNLTGTLNISLPAALESSATSLHFAGLTGSKRSMEACQIGESVKEVARNLGQIGGFFCHLDVESDKITFGKRYKITFQGEEFGRIWVDNSKAADGKIAVYMCQPDSEGVVALRQKIDITGVTEEGAKGTISNLGSEGAHSWASDISFDA